MKLIFLTLFMRLKYAKEFFKFNKIESPSNFYETYEDPNVIMYDTEYLDIVTNPSLETLTFQLLKSKKPFCYRVGSRKYKIYAMNKVLEVNEGVSKVLGYFKKIKVMKDHVEIKYADGDINENGKQSNCTVIVVPNIQDSIKVSKSEKDKLILEIEIGAIADVARQISASVYIRNNEYTPIVSKVFTNMEYNSEREDDITSDSNNIELIRPEFINMDLNINRLVNAARISKITVKRISDELIVGKIYKKGLCLKHHDYGIHIVIEKWGSKNINRYLLKNNCEDFENFKCKWIL